MSLTKSFSSCHRRYAMMTGIAFLACAPLPASADDLEANQSGSIPAYETFDTRRFGGMRQKLADWDVMVGAGVMYAPKFEGSNEFELVPIPMISATLGDRVTIDPGGLNVDVFVDNGFKVAVKGGYDVGGGRKESDSPHLRGLGNIDAGAFLGAQISYEIGPMEFYASVDKTIGGSKSLLGQVGANVTHHYNRFIFSAGGSATFADDNHMRSYFGVSGAQSARSGLRQHKAGAGLKRFDVEASITYMPTEHWFVRGQGGVGFLTGDARNSPIVQEHVQPSAMVILGYKF
tara:strand:- start:51077 stop:51943 length:867 start_codon:yes stop_codon:yes gene_type:complete